LTTLPLSSPYQRADPPPRTWWEKARGKSFPDRAQAALESGLHTAFPSQVLPEVVSAALGEFGIAGAEARAVLLAAWSKALERFVGDDELQPDEVSYLEGLARRLSLSATEVESAISRIIHPRFQKSVAEVLADGKVDDAERARLREIGDRLRLPTEVQLRLYVEQAGPMLQATVDQAIADRRLSPEESAAITKMAEDLGIEVKMSPETQTVLARFSRLWELENGILPVVDAGINLAAKEVCHLTCQVEWHELRTRTTRIDYAGPTASIRIMRGVRFRVGSIVPRRVTKDELTPIDAGTLYITSKRLLFDGTKKNITIRYPSIMAIQPFADCIVIEKTTGRSPHLMISGDVEVIAATLSAAMAAG